ncbi:MAG TPA: cytochrome c3 family protein [Prolixibacteraceae bacterium]|nr:cytochrome c3 family protein [Prolixibacteraceae bacterium]
MKYRLIILFSAVFLCVLNVYAYENPKQHTCLKCHSGQFYSFNNEVTGTVQKRLMNPYYILDTLALNTGVHKNFDCTDCHSGEYEAYPHQANLKLEPLSTCLDCHGGDESFASYQFETIQEEVSKSVHAQVYGDSFTCTKCHNPHTYYPTARTSDNVMEIVDYSNKLCLSCHNDMKKYKMVSGHDNPKLVEVHDWLPNQELHFRNVRCIECHTEVVDSLMVSHNILKKDQAVKKCVECHSANSRLKASLYKYENLQKRAENGGVNGILANSSYVIGTHESPFLKLLSIIILLVVLTGIIIHSTFRILKK